MDGCVGFCVRVLLSVCVCVCALLDRGAVSCGERFENCTGMGGPVRVYVYACECVCV